MKGISEVDLYAPLAEFFQSKGYTVRSEVKGCDLVALREDDLVIVELKRSFSVDLLIQATTRQKVADTVYVAIPRPAWSMRSKKWRGLVHLVKRLELGLILVSFSTPRPLVEVAVEPGPYEKKQSRKLRKSIIQEADHRSGDFNVGGSVRRKLVTAYRERAILAAMCLCEYGPLSPQQLRDMGCHPDVRLLLSRNVYGWFERVEKGIYALSERGQIELTWYPEVTSLFSVPEKR